MRILGRYSDIPLMGIEEMGVLYDRQMNGCHNNPWHSAAGVSGLHSSNL